MEVVCCQRNRCTEGPCREDRRARSVSLCDRQAGRASDPEIIVDCLFNQAIDSIDGLAVAQPINTLKNKNPGARMVNHALRDKCCVTP
jgi:hypothetical protein